jgi:hypothetical protein
MHTHAHSRSLTIVVEEDGPRQIPRCGKCGLFHDEETQTNHGLVHLPLLLSNQRDYGQSIQQQQRSLSRCHLTLSFYFLLLPRLTPFHLNSMDRRQVGTLANDIG